MGRSQRLSQRHDTRASRLLAQQRDLVKSWKPKQMCVLLERLPESGRQQNSMSREVSNGNQSNNLNLNDDLNVPIQDTGNDHVAHPVLLDDMRDHGRELRVVLNRNDIQYLPRRELRVLLNEENVQNLPIRDLGDVDERPPLDDEENFRQPEFVQVPLPHRNAHANIPKKRTNKLAIVLGSREGTERTVPIFNLGGLERICGACGAKFFQKEPILSKYSNGVIAFNTCCMYGNITAPRLRASPLELEHLWTDEGPALTTFREEIRSVNSLFALASFKTKRPYFNQEAEERVGAQLHGPAGRGLTGQGYWCFGLSGQIYHYANDIPLSTPQPDETIQHNQYYFVDAADAIQRRNDFLDGRVSGHVIRLIEECLREVNPYISSFRMMKDVIATIREERGEDALENLVVGFKEQIGRDLVNHQTLNSEVAAVFIGEPPIDVHLKLYPSRANVRHQNEIKNLNKYSDPFVYPLIFPFGEVGLGTGDLKHVNDNKFTTLHEFYKYRMQMRGNGFSLLHNSGKLFQQYVVDAYVKDETNRLFYFKQNQIIRRSASFIALRNYVEGRARDENARVGTLQILPSSFGAGNRHINRLYLDAMTVVARHGKPDLFVTMTCNPNWPEIKLNLEHKQKWQNRPDLVCRVFHAKLKELLDDFCGKQLYGVVKNMHYAIEFQKRGLPHAHIVFTMIPEDKIESPAKIDQIISAEIPDKTREPHLYDIIAENYVHRKCGPASPNAKCMIDGRCSKLFPKDFCDETITNFQSFSSRPEYRRTNQGRNVVINGEIYDNRWIVPYNRYAALKYRCHINFEVVGALDSVKYLYKYVHKSDESVILRVSGEGANRVVDYNEIDHYVSYRWMGSMEATWRTFGYHMNGRSHSVDVLPIHLSGQQDFLIDPAMPDAMLLDQISKPSKLMGYFTLNQIDPNARQLKYESIPEHYVWNVKEARWDQRKKQSKVLGALWEVSPNDVERYHLRILLRHVRGATSFEQLKIVRGDVCPTFVEACQRLGYLDNADALTRSLEEAQLKEIPSKFRRFFAILCLVTVDQIAIHALPLWNAFKNPHAIADFLRRGFPRSIALRLALNHIENVIKKNKDDFDLNTLGLIDPEASTREEAEEYLNSRQIDPVTFFDQGNDVEVDFPIELLNQDQLDVYHEVMYSILVSLGKITDARLRTLLHIPDAYEVSRVVKFGLIGKNLNVLFLDGPGGTGKTFLYNVIICQLKSAGLSVLPVAWTGIAASLLRGGQTSHRGFKMPCNIQENSKIGWPADHERAIVLKNIALIIWDEASMVSKYALQAVDRYYRDLMGVHDRAFGGKVFLLGGDFRQTLPIIVRGSEAQIIAMCLKSSPLWPVMRKFRLNINVRARNAAVTLAAADPHRDEEEIRQHLQSYADWLLQMGEGRLPHFTSANNTLLPWDLIKIPAEYIIGSKEALLNWVYPNEDTLELGDKAILCTTNACVDVINDFILDSMLPGQTTFIHSLDVHVHDERDQFHVPHEVINACGGASMAPHELKLKVGAVVMLLINLDIDRQQCNGTRFTVEEISDHLLSLKCINRGANFGQIVWVPKVNVVREFSHIPGKVRRFQFPIKLAFAMTINKSQGQTFSRVGVYLPNPVFSHGQLYVAFSRVGAPENIRLCIENTTVQGQLNIRRDGSRVTRNVVFINLFSFYDGENGPIPYFPPPPLRPRVIPQPLPPPVISQPLSPRPIVTDYDVFDNVSDDDFDRHFMDDDNFEELLVAAALTESRKEIYFINHSDFHLRQRISVGDGHAGTSGDYFKGLANRKRRKFSSSTDSD